MLNAIVSLLICKGVVTKEEGKEFAKRAGLAVLPHEFETSFDMVQGWMEEIEQGR